MPKLTKDFLAVPDGEIYPVQYRAGDEVSGQVAEAAKAEGILEAEKAKAPTKKAMKAPENK